MGQFGQTNDLQEAIDQVANNKDTGDESANTDTQTDNVNAIQDQLGVPPMPEPFPAPEGNAPFSDILPPAQPPADSPADNPGDDVPPAAPAPEDAHSTNAPIDIVNPVHQINPSDAPAPADTLAGEQPAPADTPQDVEQPVTDDSQAPIGEQQSAEQILGATLDNNDDLKQVRENILKDLMPLMDKVQSTPEEKFDIYKDAMNTLHDKNLISDAYRTATQISDESKKAESLMSLMQEIDKM
ncbi:hypothetical protein IKE88_01455 [Candidatus Saccharibacteria bacterium]|nr:hypothetical protein [Candidatus Saccharibacteria bacterium]